MPVASFTPDSGLPLAHVQQSSRIGYRHESSVSPGRRSESTNRATSRAPLIRAGRKTPSVSPTPDARRQDWRDRLPPVVSRFIGWRSGQTAPFRPLFAFQDRIPRRLGALRCAALVCKLAKHKLLFLENSLLSCIGAFVAILIVEALQIGSPLFNHWGGAPLIIASLGATAVLIYSTIESPLSQPRNVLGGQMLSALVAIIVTRLFRLNSAFRETATAQSDSWGHLVWICAGVSMGLALLVMELTGTVHPPGGATSLIVSTQVNAERLEWRFLLVLFASVVLMLAWALVVNNVGHRKVSLSFDTYGFNCSCAWNSTLITGGPRQLRNQR